MTAYTNGLGVTLEEDVLADLTRRMMHILDLGRRYGLVRPDLIVELAARAMTDGEQTGEVTDHATTLARVPSLFRGTKPDFAIGDMFNRWHLTPCEESKPALYIHHLKGVDHRTLHSHPWPFIGIIISGEYEETLSQPNGDLDARFELWSHRRSAGGNALYRAASVAHRLDPIGEVWTVVVRGPKDSEWGFLCPEGWHPWSHYLKNGDIAVIGAGCG